jgi:penicillin-binding protein 2
VAQNAGRILGIEPEKIVQKVSRSKKINGPFAAVRLKENLSLEEVVRSENDSP